MSAAKDIIYIDIDDEITGLIDKVRGANEKIVALVLPKRAAMLQSIVNMKLLKRTADETGRRVVLITSESGLIPLAGAVGLYVAKTLQSKPVVPPAPAALDGQFDQPVEVSESAAIDPLTPVGELADSAELDTIEIDNADAVPVTGAAASAKKVKKSKIPNFESFRLRLILGVVGLILVAAGWYLAFYVMPRATVVITTDSSQIASSLNFTASQTAKELDQERAVVPALNKELSKTDSEKVAATGKKDVGSKASGSVNLTNCNRDDETLTVPAGTGLSTANLTYISSEAVTIPPSNFAGNGDCKNDSSKEVAVIAQNPGESYNVAAGRTFAVAGYSSLSGLNTTAMSGGKSRIVKIVNQQDVDNASKRLRERAAESVEDELEQVLKDDGYVAIVETINDGTPTITQSPSVGDEASEVTVSSVITYQMLGVKEADLKKLIETSVESEIDSDKQVILDYGLDKAIFRLSGRESNGSARLSLQTLVEAGPQLDEDAIKTEVAGKKKGQARELLQTRPGIQSAEVRLQPFWVAKAPKNTNKISVSFEAGQSDRADDQ